MAGIPMTIIITIIMNTAIMNTAGMKTAIMNTAIMPMMAIIPIGMIIPFTETTRIPMSSSLTISPMEITRTETTPMAILRMRIAPGATSVL